MSTILAQILKSSLEVKGMKLGLDRIRRFDAALGYPSRQFPSVHIAGTNGKGSVAIKIASAFKGKKVGLFTSPHIHCYRERIQINGQMIPEKIAHHLLSQILEQIDKRPTYFELLTLLGFSYFAAEKVDLAVLEVGMGGRLDATNIVTPLLSVITSIELDHMQYLGNTKEAIAREKGGIIKPKIPVVVGPNARYYPDNDYLYEVKGSFAHYGEENQAIATRALHLLGVDQEIGGFIPARFEQIGNVILDVGHNPSALKAVFRRIAYHYPKKKVRALVAFSADKDITSCLRVIQQHADSYHLIKFNHPRLYQPKEGICLQDALKLAQGDELILISGTFFIMPEAKRLLNNKTEGAFFRFSH